MARIGVDYSTVKQTAIKLLSQGINPSVQKIRDLLGTGSNTTIAEHLNRWREEHAQKTIHHLPATMPKELISTVEVLWHVAMEQAQNELAQYKQTIEAEHEAVLHRERDAEKSVLDIKQKLVEIYASLEQETVDKQKLNVELAVVNERLVKQDEALTIRKNLYEDRLKNIYEEKDHMVMQCQQLQYEIRALQERFSLQTEQHQHLLAQQNDLHEQSEIRWLNLIDHARQDTKIQYKKLKQLRDSYGEKMIKLKSELSDLQQHTHEKNAQLKVYLEQINQFRQENKNLETENIKAMTTIIKLEEEKKISVN